MNGSFPEVCSTDSPSIMVVKNRNHLIDKNGFILRRKHMDVNCSYMIIRCLTYSCVPCFSEPCYSFNEYAN